MVVSVGQTFEVGDHDFSRCSITPSVSLQVNIPENVEESWYKGRVHVINKDTVFQPSSPARHAVELEGLIGPHPNPILMLYSEGGPDHRCTYLSVQLTMIYLWSKLDVDLLILARTPPGNSWRNPAERVMSQLNLGLQAIGTMRQKSKDATQENRIVK